MAAADSASGRPASAAEPTSTTCKHLNAATRNSSADAPTSTARHLRCAHEPSLPPLLSVAADPTDPTQIDVIVMPGLERTARLRVESKGSVVWQTPGGGDAGARLLRLHKGDPPAKLRLRRAPAKGQTRPPAVRVTLQLLDPQGRPDIEVSQDVPAAPAKPGAKRSAAAQPAADDDGVTTPTASRTRQGRSASGAAIRARVPAAAPQPTVAAP